MYLENIFYDKGVKRKFFSFKDNKVEKETEKVKSRQNNTFDMSVLSAFMLTNK